MGTLILKLYENDLTNFDIGENTIEDLLTEVLNYSSPDGEDNVDFVCGELRHYHSTDGGAPQVDDFEIADITYNAPEKTGEFTLEYNVYFYYGCSDLNNNDSGEQRWSFKIDRTQNKLIITTEERKVRDTFEEF